MRRPAARVEDLRGDGDRPGGIAVQVVDRPVDRVDDPAHPAGARDVAAFLAEQPVVGPGGQQARPDELLGRVIHLGDDVGRRALGRQRRYARLSRPASSDSRPRGRPPGPARAGSPGRRRRAVAHESRSDRSTYGRIPPWRKYSASPGVSMRTTASKLGVAGPHREGRPSSRSTSASPRIVNVSCPVSPSDSADSPVAGTAAAARPSRSGWSGGCARKTSAMTARTPSSDGALGGPVARGAAAVLLARRASTSGTPSCGVLHRRVVDRHLPRRRAGERVTPPSVPGASWLRSRMLANVPRIITSWLPRREP